MPIPDGWVQVIRGHRPKSENWPRANPSAPLQGAQGGTSAQRGGGIHLARVRPSCGVSRPLWQFWGPEESGARAELHAVQARQGGAETIAAIFTDTGMPGWQKLVSRSPSWRKLWTHWKAPAGPRLRQSRRLFVKAKTAAHEKPLTELIADCKRVHRSRRQTIGEVGGRESVGDHFVGRRSCPSCTSGSPSRGLVCKCLLQHLLSELEAEVSRFREELANARGVSSTNAGHQPPKKRLREDFVPNTVEEAALWMRCRQQEMEEAISMGREADVSRLACVIAEGAVQLRQWTQPPSSVGEHGELRVCVSRLGVTEPPAKIAFHQCGFGGCRIGEASNPGHGLGIVTRSQTQTRD